MPVYSKNIFAKFHPDLKRWALGFLEEHWPKTQPQQQQEQQQQEKQNEQRYRISSWYENVLTECWLAL